MKEIKCHYSWLNFNQLFTVNKLVNANVCHNIHCFCVVMFTTKVVVTVTTLLCSEGHYKRVVKVTILKNSEYCGRINSEIHYYFTQHLVG